MPDSASRALPPIFLTVAVLTYRRPLEIQELLPLLAEQARRNSTDDLRIGLLVVDNDPEGGAEAAVQEFAAGESVSTHYENETMAGISAARNRALEASRGADLLVFIDDDERPDSRWLECLLATWDGGSSTAVVGPVISSFEIVPDPWITVGRFFVRRRLTTGTVVGVAATNNLLIDLRFVRLHDIRFDLDFGISGGDDTMFTREFTRAGGIIVWCDEAVVFDVVPRSRITRRWVTLRAMSSGNSWSITSVKLAATAPTRFATRLTLTGKGLIRLVGGSASIAFGLAGRRIDLRARGVRTLARGVGMITGAFGYKYLEYRRPERQ